MATIPSIAMIPSGYKASKVYSVLPTDGAGDLTFSRAGALPSFNATRVNSDGLIEQVLSNVPRFDYSDGGCPSLLIEPESRNLLLRSEEFDDASWNKINTTITANSASAPDGTITADLINETTVNGFQAVEQLFTSPASGTYTFSCFLKQGSNTFGGVRAVVNGFTNRHFVLLNLSNGTIAGTNTFGTGVTWSSSVVSFSDGWYKLSITALHTSGNASITISSAPNSTPTYIGALPSFLGNASNNISSWGAQLEALPYATSYIPTVGSTVTRVEETASKTGLSSLINSSEGVLFAEMAALANDNTERVINISDGTADNRILISFGATSNQLRFRFVSSATEQALITTTSYNALNFNKVAISYKFNEVKVYVNGSIIGTDTNVNVPIANTFNKINFKNEFGGGTFPFYGKVKNLQVYPTALSDLELIALTTL